MREIIAGRVDVWVMICETSGVVIAFGPGTDQAPGSVREADALARGADWDG